jgi:hypothetical protein
MSQETYDQVKDRVKVGKTIKATLPGKKGEYTLYEVIAFSSE